MSAAQKLPHDYLISKIDELPTLPTIVYELTQIINDPMSSTSDVEKVMANDQSLTTKVLKLVNSAYYAIPGGVSSLSRAIAYIGFDTVNQLVLSSSIIDALEVDFPSDFEINEFWKHSVGVGIAAETIAKFTKYPMPADLFTCGLIHDMGKIALLTIDMELLLEISKFAKDNDLSFNQAELEIDVITHTQIGKLLSDRWTLPMQLRAAIAHHHQKDPMKRGGISNDLNKIVDIVYLSNLLVHALKFGNSGHNHILGAPKDVMQRLTIDPQKDFKPLVKLIKDNLDKASDFIKLICG